MHDAHHRSVAKAISWRVIASLITMILVWIFTGELLLSLGVGAVEIVTKFVFYYLHERAWDKIAWGTLDSSHTKDRPDV